MRKKQIHFTRNEAQRPGKLQEKTVVCHSLRGRQSRKREWWKCLLWSSKHLPPCDECEQLPPCCTAQKHGAELAALLPAAAQSQAEIHEDKKMSGPLGLQVRHSLDCCPCSSGHLTTLLVFTLSEPNVCQRMFPLRKLSNY